MAALQPAPIANLSSTRTTTGLTETAACVKEGQIFLFYPLFLRAVTVWQVMVSCDSQRHVRVKSTASFQCSKSARKDPMVVMIGCTLPGTVHIFFQSSKTPVVLSLYLIAQHIPYWNRTQLLHFVSGLKNTKAKSLGVLHRSGAQVTLERHWTLFQEGACMIRYKKPGCPFSLRGKQSWICS